MTLQTARIRVPRLYFSDDFRAPWLFFFVFSRATLISVILSPKINMRAPIGHAN